MFHHRRVYNVGLLQPKRIEYVIVRGLPKRAPVMYCKGIRIDIHGDEDLFPGVGLENFRMACRRHLLIVSNSVQLYKDAVGHHNSC